jgi:hypothetical protein
METLESMPDRLYRALLAGLQPGSKRPKREG